MEVKESFEIVIICLFYLIWNILNEVSVNHFWNTGDLKYVKDWHKYDAWLRIVLFPIVILSIVGYTFTAIKIILIVAILYRPLFNIGFNYWRNRITFKELTFKEKLNVLLYLSEHSSIDRYLIKANNWLYRIIYNFSLWLFKISKERVNININVRFQYFNLGLIIIELVLVVLLIIWI